MNAKQAASQAWTDFAAGRNNYGRLLMTESRNVAETYRAAWLRAQSVAY